MISSGGSGWSLPATATSGCAPTAPARTSPGARPTSRTSPNPSHGSGRGPPSTSTGPARLLIGNGWGFRLHATYDETIRQDLDVFEKIARQAGQDGLGLPWLFDHAETLSDLSIDRIKALGGNVAVQNRRYFQGRVF